MLYCKSSWIKPIPEHILRHEGDVAWLEEHGQAARAEYLALHRERDRSEAKKLFSLIMFSNEKTGGIYNRAPNWWRQEQAEAFDQFKADIAKIHPAFKGAWGDRNPWRDRPARSTKGSAKAVARIASRSYTPHQVAKIRAIAQAAE